jgi:hypothetical protein
MPLGQIGEQGSVEEILYGRWSDGFHRCRHEMPVLRSVGDGPQAVACHRLEGERLERSAGG